MNDVFSHALDVERMGYRPIPLAPGAKSPPAGFPLAEHFHRHCSVREDERWFVDAANIGIVTHGLAVLDFDDKQEARDFYKRMKGVLRTVDETLRGTHFLFRAPRPSFPSRKFARRDVKASGGYIVLPYSVVDSWEYRFVDGHPLVSPDELPVLDESLLDEFPPVTAVNRAMTRGEVRDALAYITRLHAHSGQGGHNATFRCACILASSGMSQADVIEAMIDWNQTNAHPQWSIKQLIHKVRDAFERKQ